MTLKNRMGNTNAGAATVLSCPLTGLPIMPLWPMRVMLSWPTANLLAFLALVVGGIVFFCGPPVSEKVASTAALAIVIGESAVVAAGLYLLRQKIADAIDKADIPLPRALPWLADLSLIFLLTAILPAIDAQFFAVDQSLRELAKAATYHALVVSLFSARLSVKTAVKAMPRPQPKGKPASAASGLQFIEAEGHYVKLVYLDKVEHRRARFMDVIADLETAGLQVQKSFWVNRDAVATVRRCGRGLKLVLKDGAQIPVGRNKERAVLEAFPELRVRQRHNGSDTPARPSDSRIRAESPSPLH